MWEADWGRPMLYFSYLIIDCESLIFFKPASFVSEEMEIHLKIPVSLLTASMFKIGGIRQLRDDPWHEKFTPCQYWNHEPVAGNLKQQILCWEKRKKITALHLLRSTVSSKDLNILSSALAVSLQEFGGNSLFPWLHSVLNYLSKTRRLFLINQTQGSKA